MGLFSDGREGKRSEESGAGVTFGSVKKRRQRVTGPNQRETAPLRVSEGVNKLELSNIPLLALVQGGEYSLATLLIRRRTSVRTASRERRLRRGRWFR